MKVMVRKKASSEAADVCARGISAVRHDQNDVGTDSQPPAKKSRLFEFTSLDDASDSPVIVAAKDDLTSFLSRPCSDADIDRFEKDYKVQKYALQFWAKESALAERKDVLYRILAMPPSSCVSERKFSAVARVPTRDRMSLNHSITDDIIFLRFGYSMTEL